MAETFEGHTAFEQQEDYNSAYRIVAAYIHRMPEDEFLSL